jgi:hypothetical protein
MRVRFGANVTRLDPPTDQPTYPPFGRRADLCRKFRPGVLRFYPSVALSFSFFSSLYNVPLPYSLLGSGLPLASAGGFLKCCLTECCNLYPRSGGAEILGDWSCGHGDYLSKTGA